MVRTCSDGSAEIARKARERTRERWKSKLIIIIGCQKYIKNCERWNRVGHLLAQVKTNEQCILHIEVTIMESMGSHGRSTLSQFCDKCMIYREWAKRTVRSFNSCCSSFLWLELYINNQSRYTANTHCCFFQCEPMHFDLWLVWCGSTFDCCRCWWLNKSDFFFFVGSSSFWRLINNQVIYYQRLSNSHAYTQNIVCYKQKERDRFTRKIFLALSFSFPSSSDDCDFCLLSELCLSFSISASIISHFRLLKWIQRS